MSSSSKQASKTSPPITKPESGLKSFITGGFGGACCVMVGHPFDLVKVRIQAASGSSSPGVFSILKHTFVNEGVRGLYRGVSAPLAATTPMFAVSFFSYNLSKKVVQKINAPPGSTGEEDFTIPQICLAGALSAFPTVVIMAPSERIKCLLQTQTTSSGKPLYNGMLHCAKELYRTGGIASIYKGTFATLLRDIPGSTAYFGTYEFVKRTLISYQQEHYSQSNNESSPDSLSPGAVLVAGGLAGMACWGVSIPPDVIKSRYQIAPDGQYKNIYEVFTVLMKTEGPSALTRGMGPALIRAFPANAACFLGMEAARKALFFME